MRGLAGEYHIVAGNRQISRVASGGIKRVGHQTGVNSRKRIFFQQDYFAAVGFFAWRSHHDQPAGDGFLFHDFFDGQSGGYGRRGNQIVSAGVSEFRQRIILAYQAECRRTAAGFGFKSRGHGADRIFHSEPCGFEDGDLAGGGVEFIESKLRVSMY